MKLYIDKECIELDFIEYDINEKIAVECDKYNDICTVYSDAYNCLFISGKKENLYDILYFITNEFCEYIERIY